MFALFCILTFVIMCFGAYYLGDYCGKREAEARREMERREAERREIERRKNEREKEHKKATTFYPLGAKVMNEKGEFVDAISRGEAVMMHFLLNHKDKKLSTVELYNATDAPSGTVLSLEKRGWILYEKKDNDYYPKVLLNETGKKLFLEAF